MENELAALLQEAIDTMTEGGTFEAMDHAPEDSGLPFVYAKLCKALELAQHFTASPRPDLPQAHRLQ